MAIRILSYVSVNAAVGALFGPLDDITKGPWFETSRGQQDTFFCSLGGDTLSLWDSFQ